MWTRWFGTRSAPQDVLDVPPAPDPDACPGTILGNRYRLDRYIAKGATAQVFQAFDSQLELEVAIKVTRVDGDAGVQGDLRAEAVSAMKLSHPFIARTYHWDRFGVHEVIVMEHVRGKNLHLIQRDRPDGCLPVDEACGFAIDLLEALQHAHEQGIIHNDIKPRNLLVAPGEQLKVVDFGIARKRDAAWDRRNTLISGTAAFMAPERVRSEPSDATSDLYSVGATLYTLLVGQPPFGVSTEEAFDGHQNKPVRVPGRVPEGVARVLITAMAKAREERFGSAAHMADALRMLGFRSRYALAHGLPGVASSAAVGLVLPVGLESDASGGVPRVERSGPVARVERSGPVARVERSGPVARVERSGPVAVDPADAPSVPGNNRSDVEESAVHPAWSVDHDPLDAPAPATWSGAEPKVAPPVRSAWTAPLAAPTPDSDGARHHSLARLLGHAKGVPVAEAAPPVYLPRFDVSPGRARDGMVRIGPRAVRQGLRTYEVRAFFLDVTVVTCEDWARYCMSTGVAPPAAWVSGLPPEDQARHPMVGVTFAEAKAFAAWRGRRLPTALEWLAAATGADGLFPWGGPCAQDRCHCPFLHPAGTAPVDAHPQGASLDGVHGLYGNVWEWTDRDERLHPDRPDLRYVFGASFKHPCTAPRGVVPRNQLMANVASPYVGFRCAADEGGEE